jgi:hypothetical protein
VAFLRGSVDKSSIAIIASGKLENLEICMPSLVGQSLPFAKIILIAWGEQQDLIYKEWSERSNDIIDVIRTHHKNMAMSRNAGICHLINRKIDTKYLAFIDDDICLSKRWNDEMMHKAICLLNPKMTFASVNFFRDRDKMGIIQSCGHYLPDASPRDVGYEKRLNEVYENKTPRFPCANGGFFPWRLIEEIQLYETEVWDSRFDRMSCFDFGLKSAILGYKCEVADKAKLCHDGLRELNDAQVKKQLADRMLLYRKFYPPDDRDKAMNMLRAKMMNKWIFEGYPHGTDNIRGKNLINIFVESCDDVSKYDGVENNPWIDKISELTPEERHFILFE